MKNALTLFILIAFSNACVPLIDSPFSDQLQRPERVLNENAASGLTSIEDDGVLRFAVYADSHQNYAELRQMITVINDEPQLDFTVSLGDFTNSGYNFEYDEFIRAFASIRHPSLTVIGNHDAIGAGPELFKRAFGPLNFFFESATYRFIFFNSNNIEAPSEFNTQWLQERIDESLKDVLIFTHISLRDDERFSTDLEPVFTAVLSNPRVKAVFNGHDHTFRQSTDNGSILIQCGRVANPGGGFHWLKITMPAGQLCVEQMDSREAMCFNLK
jgi:predicted phosphodiesterase